MLVLLFIKPVLSQQVQWAKVYRMPKADYIYCVTKDDSSIYAGGRTYRNATLNNYYKAILIKLDLSGDTVFVKDIGVHGRIKSMTIDYIGNLRLNVEQYFFGPPSAYRNFLIQMTPGGGVFKTDTIPRYALNACTMGKDSSLIIVGSKPRTGGGTSETSMYFWRMDKNGILDPWVELNPGHPGCVANHVEQLPNGHYLISGNIGSRVASFEVDSVGGNPVFHQWYQTPDLTNINFGSVGGVGLKNWFVAGDGTKTFVSIYDSTQSKIWKKNDNGILAPPQGMKDSTVVFGYSSGFAPFNFFYRFRADSSQVWFFNMRDSLTQRGYPGIVDWFSFAYFPDESAVFAGSYYESGATGYDPFFMRVANVGTPVTSLSKPKRGTLSNETLAPWPNPTGGTLYLKQHFDKAEVHFYTVGGKEMGSYAIRFGQPIDVSAFPQGLYFYRAVIDGKAYSGRVLRK